MKKEPIKAQEVAAAQRITGFNEVLLGYSEEQALAEAGRCIQCKNPTCISGCPVGIDIKKFIAQIAEKDYKGAYFTIREKNNFPSICGRVCPAEYQCRKTCVFTKKGEPFASSIAPSNGRDIKGPTALLNSVNRVDAAKFANGINLNLKFDAGTIGGERGRSALQSLFETYFARGGMQVQLNVLDPAILREARDNPGTHPNILVRISGYSAYFSDLTPAMQEEIIRRTCLSV